jgi:predicted nucleic-acid-binding protein
MTAVDTNLVVRLLTQDDPKQAAVADAMFATEQIWIAKTVLLETNWVLESSYGFSPNSVRSAFVLLLGLPNVQIEDEPAVASALDMVVKGIDFADALHLESRPSGARFVSFDKDFVRRAKRAGFAGVGSR